MKQEKPEPIREDELYDKPAPQDQRVVQLVPPHDECPAPWLKPDPPPPDPPPISTPSRKGEIFNVLLDILSFRIIMLLCSMSSAGLFVMASLWPDPWRLAAAAAFSAIVTAPVIFFYRKV
jgi:hypothetical protein